ncbi:lambda phage CII family protein, partial [Escherichia coli]|nr:lambda phage CII family protein [Escherichia coli]
GVVDDDIARLAKEVAAVLTKKKSPAATEDSEQITMQF